MWRSRNKNDLIIEVWEKLDCESVGASEIISIENALREQYGNASLESPMKLARRLADEGAELRHSEIMALFLERSKESPHSAVFRNVLKFSDLNAALSTIRNLENIRLRFTSDNDVDGLRQLRKTALEGKELLAEMKTDTPAKTRELEEIERWLTLWLQSPEMFENWIKVRKRSAEFEGLSNPQENQ